MPVSFVLHAAGLAGLVALSLVGPEELPATPRPPIGDVMFVAGPRAASPARPLQTSARAPRPDRRAETPVFQVPVDVPPLEPEAFSTDNESDAGCVGCTLRGGVPGGSPGDNPGDETVGTGPTGTGTEPVRVGGHIQPPRKIRHVDPVYPDLARRAGVAGVVVLDCVIDREGLIRSVQVVSGHPLLNDAAATAVRQWTYRPTRLNGVAVEIVMTVTVRFTTR